MESGVAAFDPNDLISYSPEESEDEGKPPPDSTTTLTESQQAATASSLPGATAAKVSSADLAAISGEEIQLTLPAFTPRSSGPVSVHLRSPLQGACFKCKFCPTYTHTAEDFIKHFIMHFGRNRISYKQMSREEVQALPNANEKFVCGVCGKCFEVRNDVRDHMIQDHGFVEAKTKEVAEVSKPNPSSSNVVKRKLEDDFVDSQKLTISDSSCSSDNGTVKVTPSVGQVCVVQSITPKTSIPVAGAPVTTISSTSSAVCDSDTPKSSNIQQPQLGKSQQATVSIVSKADDFSEDAELNEFLGPMTLKTLKLKLLAGLKLKCPQKGCVYKFETRAKRDIHIKCHNIEPGLIGPGGPIPAPVGKEEKKDNFKCYQCGIEFPRWRECSQHLWKQHQVDANMLKCPICDMRFDFAVKVYRHLQTHRPVKAFGCSSCSKSFATKAQLLVHENIHKKQQLQRQKQKPAASAGGDANSALAGENAEQDVDAEDEDDEANNVEGKTADKLPWYAERKCDICGHMFSTSKVLSKHIKTVHHKIKPFICSVCGYKSARKVTLTIHMRQHSGQKPLECKECPFRTADPSALKYHEKRHTKDKWYECKFCGLLTIQASALKTHIRLNHPKEYESIKCDLCNFSSVNAELLARHKSDHKAGLIRSEDSHDSVSSKRSKNAPESSSDCFLPIESTDSVVHDAGGFTIPAVINAPVAHSEETQFPT
ncbi:zinc finger protein 155 [Wyeomyia smithii]|uniref:zinc finger protein 155 n=1 Tax=Wyeomyia smithii TaxID=174621 RepID=UPI002467F5A7|nr:zinc finger protein 155 [Wyeomyia smithii]